MKQILLKATIKGMGCVNFDDSTNQKFTLKKLGITNYVGNDNVKLAKKAYFPKRVNNDVVKDEKGNVVYDYKIKISSECVRRAIFENDAEYINPMVSPMLSGSDIITANFAFSPVALTRGYMFAGEKSADFQTIKRKSPLTISDAIQTNENRATIEIGTTSGDRTPTSMFYVETIGETEYEFTGVIDMKTLMFIVADPLFDRMAIKADWIDTGLATKMLEMHYPGIAKPSFGYFSASSKCLTQNIAEYGIILNKELVEHLTKYLLKRILGVSIKRNTGYANVTSISIKEVNDIISDKFESADDWKTITTPEEIDALSFDIECPYVPSNDNELENLKELRKKYETWLKDLKEKRKGEQEEKAAKKKNKKETNE